MKWISIVFLGCLLVACGDDEISFGSGGAGGNAQGSGGAGAGGNAQGSGGAGTGGNAEGGGGAGTGGNAEGGGGAGGSSLDRTELAIAADEAATAGCATFVDGAWGVGETDFLDGEPTNDDCALVPVLVDGNPYWIASREFEGDIHIDGLEHSFSTAAAAIGEGSYSFVLRNFTFEELFAGTLEVAYVTDEVVTLSIE